VWLSVVDFFCHLHEPARTRDRAAQRTVAMAILAMLVTAPLPAHQTPAGQPPAAPQPTLPTPTFDVTVVGTTPLPGEKVPTGLIPAPVQTATDRDIDDSGALDLSDFLHRRLNGVHVNEIQSNPLQPDVNYRGYSASPLLGTPQGLSIYMDGVRLNQPFGDVVSWDLVPRIAVSTTTLMPGSNPLFGLNTLGGALSIQTKTGLSHPGTTMQGTYGSDFRRALDVEHGGRTATPGWHWYLAGSLFAEDGWRDESPSTVRQIFGKLGWQRDGRDVSVSLGHANNSLTGNGLQDVLLLETNRASIYTKPDTTDNRATLLNAASRLRVNARTSLDADVYFRHIRTATLNGDINEESLDQSLYQPGAAERAALAAAGYGTVPSSGLDASNTPFPSLRCIANALLNDEPAEQCNGLINRTRSDQRSAGLSAQLTRRDPVGAKTNIFTTGGAFERSGIGFAQSTELGYLNPDRGVTGVGAFGDGGITGGEVDGEPFDTRVDLDGHVTTWSLFAADTLPIGGRTHLTLSGRYNHTSIENRDRIQPGGGPGSLDGDHTFGRFNGAAGITIDLPKAVGVYAGYNEGSRAPTSIELGCADPDQPCRLPNAMAGDPPLDQVVTRTIEAGLRGTRGRLSWDAGFFRAANRDDILFVTSDRTGFGYFTNFGRTRRQGVELGARGRFGRLAIGAGYTWLAATFESEETVNGESNSSNDAALDGQPGLEGTIDIAPGARMPLIPRHLFKAFADVEITARLRLDVNVVAIGESPARGNENGDHAPDGVYYLGPGHADGYAVVNLGARHRLTTWLQIVGQINNLFDTAYATAAQLGPAGFLPSGQFLARPLPAIDGEFPLRHTTFAAAGAPVRAWIGTRFRF
jgi:outer membrane receptor protein involved in Fe transport